MNTILGRLTLLMGISVCCVAAFSQQGISSNVISDLKSKDWKTRLSAYEQVKAVKTPDVGSVLLELLDRETQFMRTTRAESKGRLSVSDKYGESYLDYYHDLQDSVSRTADWKDQRQLCVLAQSAYSPESTFSKRLVDKGGTLLTSCLLAMAKPNADENDRYMAIPVLVQLSAATQ